MKKAMTLLTTLAMAAGLAGINSAPASAAGPVAYYEFTPNGALINVKPPPDTTFYFEVMARDAQGRAVPNAPAYLWATAVCTVPTQPNCDWVNYQNEFDCAGQPPGFNCQTAGQNVKTSYRPADSSGEVTGSGAYDTDWNAVMCHFGCPDHAQIVWTLHVWNARTNPTVDSSFTITWNY